MEGYDNLHVDEDGFIALSVLHLEYEIPKRDSNRVYMVAGKGNDPFVEFEETLSKFLHGGNVRLIGFQINDG